MNFFKNRPLFTALLSVILAFFLGFFISNSLKLKIVICLLPALLVLCLFKKLRKLSCLVLIPFIFALLNHWLFVQYSYLPMKQFQGNEIEVQGKTITEHKLSATSSYFVLDADVVIFKDEIVPVSGDVVVYCEKDAKPIPVGSLVSCYGSAFKDDDSFSLNFRATEKQFLSIYAERHEILEKAHSFDINALSSKARNALKGVYKKVFSERAYSMICGLVLGERDLIDNETYANFKNSGVAHALAVSGMHLAFLTTILWIILSAICPNLKLRAIFQIVLIWVFAALTGFSPSCCRAAIMLTVYHLGVIVDKEADPLTSLSLAVVICCLRNPFAILNPSLMLSASSTAGLLLLSGPILRLFPVVRGHNFAVRCVQFVFQTVAMSIAATVATFPIMVAIFQSVSLLSPVTNVFVIPAIEALFIVGVVGAATFWCPPIAFLLKYIASFLANYCAFVTGLIARLPYSTVSTERVEFWIVLL
ncbi:MAG: ComEC/Rec2 family competence protein, partial [Clostridia bacterium]|nr:ComEC/Rec2 family competence protein [Clostridia bacterium]